MLDLGTHIEAINRARTPEDAFAYFAGVMAAHGYSRVAYSLVTDHPSLGLKRQHGIATSYPSDFMAHYAAHDYASFDPVTARILNTRKPFFWSDVVADPNISAASKRLMDEAQDAGVADGIGISLVGGPGELVGVGLALETPEPGGVKDYNFFAGAHLLSTFFHQSYRDMLVRTEKPVLTVRQCDILSWAAEGKTDGEIALILRLSEDTVRYHWKTIFKRLGAFGRVYAITKALRLGLITPGAVGAPYRKR